MNTDQIIQILIILLVLAVAWGILTAVLKLAKKVLACGCSVIMAVGLAMLLFRYLTGSG